MLLAKKQVRVTDIKNVTVQFSKKYTIWHVKISLASFHWKTFPGHSERLGFPSTHQGSFSSATATSWCSVAATNLFRGVTRGLVASPKWHPASGKRDFKKIYCSLNHKPSTFAKKKWEPSWSAAMYWHTQFPSAYLRHVTFVGSFCPTLVIFKVLILRSCVQNAPLRTHRIYSWSIYLDLAEKSAIHVSCW